MKITFNVEHPISNVNSLRDMKQTAQEWLSYLISAVGDQISAGGRGSVKITVDTAEFEFRVLKVPGMIETVRIS